MFSVEILANMNRPLLGKLALVTGNAYIYTYSMNVFSIKCSNYNIIVKSQLYKSTGAGSGIGRATCKLLERDGARVIAVDRNGLAAAETAKSLGTGNYYIILKYQSNSSM